MVELYSSDVNTVCEKTVGHREDGGLVYESFELVEFDKTELLKRALYIMREEKMIRTTARIEELEKKYSEAFEK